MLPLLAKERVGVRFEKLSKLIEMLPPYKGFAFYLILTKWAFSRGSFVAKLLFLPKRLVKNALK
jgi:hypothetical protein